VIRQDICEIGLGGVQDFCRDPIPPIDRSQPFVIFVTFCADSFRGYAGSGDDRDRRNLSQKISKVSKRGSWQLDSLTRQKAATQRQLLILRDLRDLLCGFFQRTCERRLL
jgi:hypothetical protein